MFEYILWIYWGIFSLLNLFRLNQLSLWVSGGNLSFKLSVIFVFSCCHVNCCQFQLTDKAFQSESNLFLSSLTRCDCQSLGYWAEVAISWSLKKSSICLGVKLYFKVSHFLVSSFLATKYGNFSSVVVESVLVDAEAPGVNVVTVCVLFLWIFCCIYLINFLFCVCELFFYQILFLIK